MKTLLGIYVLFAVCNAYPEKGLWQLDYSQKDAAMLYFSKTMFKDTSIAFSEITCSPIKTDFVLTWSLYYSQCFQQECSGGPDGCKSILKGELMQQTEQLHCTEAGLVKSQPKIISSNGPVSFTTDPEPPVKPDESKDGDSEADPPEKEPTDKTDAGGARKKRDGVGKDQPDGTDNDPGAENENSKPDSEEEKHDENEEHESEQDVNIKDTPVELLGLVKSWKDGEYLFMLNSITPEGEDKMDFKFAAKLTTLDSNGHLLSSTDFPYLYFYLTLVILYVFYGVFWLFMMARYWSDLLRIQYFVVLVIFLGLLEKIVFYSEYKHVNDVGETMKSTVIIAELISVAKRTLSRVLVIIVSVGYGIVKPRLGPTLHKLIAVAVIYSILATVEFSTKHLKRVQIDSTVMKKDAIIGYEMDEKSQMLASLPLALCEVGILYWVFSSLLQTIRALRLRRNVVKLQLYRHFTYLIIFSCLVSAGFVAWSIPRIHLAKCVTEMKEIWLDEGFWTILFTFMLLVIMILWRPSLNSSRFAKGVLLDQQDDEEEETLMMTEAFDTKKRNKSSNARKKDRKSREEKVEEDLQWIEDNIPASLADAAPGIIADSDEEIMTTRMELSKMD